MSYLRPPENPNRLRKEDLVEMIRAVQAFLFYEVDGDGLGHWTLDKSIDRSDFIDYIVEMLNRQGLLPANVQGPKDWRPR